MAAPSSVSMTLLLLFVYFSFLLLSHAAHDSAFKSISLIPLSFNVRFIIFQLPYEILMFMAGFLVVGEGISLVLVGNA